jgi:hypothetical protein
MVEEELRKAELIKQFIKEKDAVYFLLDKRGVGK